MNRIEEKAAELLEQISAAETESGNFTAEAQKAETLAKRAEGIRSRIMTDGQNAAAGISAAAEGFTGNLYENGFQPRLEALSEAYTAAEEELDRIRKTCELRAACCRARAAERMETAAILRGLYRTLSVLTGGGDGK